MKHFLLVFVFLSFLSGDLFSRVHYVNAINQTNGDGTSWSTAFNKLQDALDAAEPGDEIRVAAGIYTPTRLVFGLFDDVVDVAFVLQTDNVKIFGGYPATGNPTIDERDWVAHKTILSGDIDGDDGADGTINGINASHVVINVAKDVLLDGFTISGGDATKDFEFVFSKVYGHNTPYSINNHYGGGIYNYLSSKLILKNSIVKANRAKKGGGIINEYESSCEYVNVLICGNIVEELGGGMFNQGTDPLLKNVTISGNTTGGMYSELYSTPRLLNTIITGNEGDDDYYDDSQPDYYNCLIQGKFLINNDGPEKWKLEPEEVFRNWIPTGNSPSNFDDYRLASGSFAIDAGVNGYINEPNDLDGNPRIMNGIVDLGAFEYYSMSQIEVSVSGIPTPDHNKLKILLYKSDGTLLDKDSNNNIFENVNLGEYAVSVSYPGYIMSYNNQDGKHAPTWKDASFIAIEWDGQHIEVAATLIPEQITEKGTLTIRGTLGELIDDDLIKARPMINVNGNVNLSKKSSTSTDDYDPIKTVQTTDGEYTFSDLPEGDYRITADIAGYDPGTIDILVEEDKIINFIVNSTDKTITAELETVTKAPSVQQSNLKIYPNPATDILHISGLEGTYSVKIINVLGQLQYSVNESLSELSININHLPSGMYFVRIESGKAITTSKIIKQ